MTWTPLTRAPRARARLTPVSTPRAESGEPSVGIRMCRNMRSARDQHRQLRVREHALRLAAQDQAAQGAASVRGHDDGIAFRRPRGAQDAAPGLRIGGEALRAAYAGRARFALDSGERKL